MLKRGTQVIDIYFEKEISETKHEANNKEQGSVVITTPKAPAIYTLLNRDKT